MSIFRRYTDECLSIIVGLNLGMNCPLELIYMIMRYYWSVRCEPVCILAIDNICRISAKLRHRWYSRPIGREGPGFSILCKLRKICPGLEAASIVFERQHSSDNFYPEKLRVYPRGINFYAKWSPMILLIPGLSWDAAMTHPDNYTNLEGVQIFNGIWKNNDIHYVKQYGLEHDDFVRWFRDALNHRDFTIAQNKLL
jgi:hypothetical protein